MTGADAAHREWRRGPPREIGSDGRPYAASGDIEVVEKPALADLRPLRSNVQSANSTRRTVVSTSRMVSSSISRSSLSHSRPISKHRHTSAHAHRSETEATQHKRRKSTSKADDLSQSDVYAPPLRTKVGSSKVRVSERSRDDHSSDTDNDGVMSAVSEESESELQRKPRERKVKVIYVNSEHPRSSQRESMRPTGNTKTSRDDLKASPKSLNRSSIVSAHKLRSQSAQIIQAKPVMKKSHSISHSRRPTKSLYEPSLATSKATSKRASFFGIFAPPIKEEKPVRLVECLTCLSDDIPIVKSAKLKCGHRMCHSCLRRIFKLSVNDPQHMPPKCCTSNHIPLKHVDRLFDIPFKKLWNKKFQEYTTKNRIYCPSRRCGEWIKPANIHSEGGKKYGKCSRCKTKVCCLCNGKWHGNKDCPKDEETNALLEAAKQAGWQRCYSCRTMVELKEGCNHMTCRCRAEFCMICGVKWKSCNCPWFNYDQVENDRLEHMRDARGHDARGDRNIGMEFPARPGNFGRPPRPPGAYRDELDARRRQELLDEELARRLQVLGIDDDDNHNGRFGDIDGGGNARANFLNDEFRRPARDARLAHYVDEINRARGLSPPPPAIPSPQVLQRAEQASARPARRNAEIPILRRSTMDYVGDAARHAPVTVVRNERRVRPPRSPPAPVAEARTSVLAGLGGPGSEGGRIGAWRTHVEPGVVPAEGVLSM